MFTCLCYNIGWKNGTEEKELEQWNNLKKLQMIYFLISVLKNSMIIDSIGHSPLGNLVKYSEWSVTVAVFEKEIHVPIIILYNENLGRRFVFM